MSKKTQLTKLALNVQAMMKLQDDQKLTVAKGIREAVVLLTNSPKITGHESGDLLRKKQEHINRERAKALPFLLDLADLLEQDHEH